MTDLNKERELYESVIEKTQDLKMVHLVGISFNQEKNQYEVPGEKWASELTDACLELNTGWFIWQECVKAKAQAVPEGYVVVPKDVAERTIGHIGIAICHPNNTRDEENIMCEDQVVIERAIEASESGAEG
ncbi:hypothetical protein [Acinetobacter pittii]|uniref:hypothetical protein n=1 Tax=Acinetobacter pittii TaxID=48296 RepID=UPI00070783C9|nr:hypothetical protein [Acinetobacter pittii]KQE08446.1 hypothetical protein APD35_12730 [Acinetobacter pittii]OCY91671.1 hypothetical protein BFR67_05025 [Acinetobacter pittii]